MKVKTTVASTSKIRAVAAAFLCALLRNDGSTLGVDGIGL